MLAKAKVLCQIAFYVGGRDLSLLNDAVSAMKGLQALASHTDSVVSVVGLLGKLKVPIISLFLR